MKKISVLFGSMDSDIEFIAVLLTSKLHVTPTARENEYYGSYYTFGIYGGEQVRLVYGACSDVEGEYPFDDEFPDWKLFVCLEGSNEGSEWLKALESAGPQFQKLRTDNAG